MRYFRCVCFLDYNLAFFIGLNYLKNDLHILKHVVTTLSKVAFLKMIIFWTVELKMNSSRIFFSVLQINICLRIILLSIEYIKYIQY